MLGIGRHEYYCRMTRCEHRGMGVTRGDNSDDNSDAGDISSLSSLRPHHHSRSANTNTPARNNNNVSRVTINNKNCRVGSAQTQTDWRTQSRSFTSDIPRSDATCADINNPSIHDNLTSQFNFSRYCLAPSYSVPGNARACLAGPQVSASQAT